MMRTKPITHFLYLLGMCALLANLCQCASQKPQPNLSIADEKYLPPKGVKGNDDYTIAKSVLGRISTKNTLLALELGKLPELQDGVSRNEREALESLAKIYDENREAFDRAFDQMYKIGLPEVRKYNAPLQGLFWLVLDGKSDEVSNLIVDYSLSKLLERAWKFEAQQEKWKDFNTVIYRLNAPELVHFYINKNFTYAKGPHESEYDTFHRKIAQCITSARFGEYALKRAGYKTFIRSVDFPGEPCCSDHTGSGVIMEDGSYLVVVDFGPYGNRTGGPYKDISELDWQLSHGNEIIDRRWGHKTGVEW